VTTARKARKRQPAARFPRGRKKRTCLDVTWQTPEEILERDRVYCRGPIPFDPATALDNPTRALRYCALPANADTPLFPQPDLFVPPPAVGELVGSDGLALAWAWPTWVNPPYGEVLPAWLGKIATEAQRTRTDIRALLPCSRWEQGYWQKALAVASVVCFIRGRVEFRSTVDYELAGGNPGANMVLGFNVDRARFYEAYSPLGGCFEVKAMVPPPPPKQGCNRHSTDAECVAAQARAKERGNSPWVACCHTDDCEDCFGS
jgi:hypothetical protein